MMDKVMICLDHTWLPREYMRVDLTDRVIVSDRALHIKRIILHKMQASSHCHKQQHEVPSTRQHMNRGLRVLLLLELCSIGLSQIYSDTYAPLISTEILGVSHSTQLITST